jgi:glycerate dehydrogenase
MAVTFCRLERPPLAQTGPKIVCLDGYTLNPGDLSWEPFEVLGQLVVHDRTPRQQLLPHAQGAMALLTNKVPLHRQTLTQLPDLRYIGVLATGYNVIDVQAADECGVVVTNVPAYGTESVAQHTIALMLELMRQVGAHHHAVHTGQWSGQAEWCLPMTPIWECTGKTLGIVGLGRIGLAVARVAAAMGMRLIAHVMRQPPEDQLASLPVRFVELDELFEQADVVSLHCPQTPDTQNMVNAQRLARMKRSAFLINTSRGGLVDSVALAQALRSGTIAGAALDVLEQEPPPPDHPLIAAPNCIITPHVAWYALEARARLMKIAADNLASFLAGQPVNVVS